MSIFPTKILLATDGSAEAEAAARVAAALADKTASEVHVVYVEVVPYSAQYSAAAAVGYDREVKLAGVAVAEDHLRMGAPDEEIVGLAETIGAGLIVMGSRGRGGIKRALLGGVSDSVIRHAHCPVLVVRA